MERLNMIEIYDYDLKKFNFTDILKNMLEVNDLTKINSGLDFTKLPLENSLYKNMEQSELYKRLYKNLKINGGNFYETYRLFIQEVIYPLFKEPIYYQVRPTHRIHFIDGRGQLRFHRDSDYGHYEEEINFLVPQTPVYGTNSIYLESSPGEKDFKAIKMSAGQFLKFKGTKLEHGARVNLTDESRVSFDFRIIPFSKAPSELKENIKAENNVKSKDLNEGLLINPHRFQLYERS